LNAFTDSINLGSSAGLAISIVGDLIVMKTSALNGSGKMLGLHSNFRVTPSTVAVYSRGSCLLGGLPSAALDLMSLKRPMSSLISVPRVSAEEASRGQVRRVLASMPTGRVREADREVEERRKVGGGRVNEEAREMQQMKRKMEESMRLGGSG